ncbi:hypothetical protein TUBRATIS_30730 [Tubulinosema ratisbonensis]|uniref:Transcription factor CBF/NF-Y/archaeal histone domain-containing protein n=1 Tax=Tubulinosema ratisbonensis TaxID=291195 RepID=A0A437AHB1_9MICR|nr:hypothetical protein TUBRATIS_30730 [Tubulinosema ratisbonensis]
MLLTDFYIQKYKYKILSDQPYTIVNLEQMHKPEENNSNLRKKIKKENQLFSKNKILKILKELNLNFENTELISNNLEIFVKNLIRNSITKAISKGRKTLFVEDIKESIKEMRLFYLYDLINE